jgi:hypothetical protein
MRSLQPLTTRASSSSGSAARQTRFTLYLPLDWCAAALTSTYPAANHADPLELCCSTRSNLHPLRFVLHRRVIRTLKQSVSLHCTHGKNWRGASWFRSLLHSNASNCSHIFLLTMDCRIPLTRLTFFYSAYEKRNAHRILIQRGVQWLR